MFNGVAEPSEPLPTTATPADTPVYASLGPPGASGAPGSKPSAASLFLATTAQAVEHAASAVVEPSKPVSKNDLAKADEAKGAL